MIEPVGLSAGGFGLISAGLRTCMNAKKNHLDSVYSHGASQKKPRKHVTGVSIIDLSAGSLSLEDVASIGGNSKVSSEASSISGLSNVENMRNMVTEKTSYTESDNSVVNKDMNNTMPRKTHTQMYMLGQPSKSLVFTHMSDVNDDNAILLLSSNFSGSKCLPLAELCVLEKRCFNSTKFFALDIELSAVSDKTIELSLKRARKLAIYEKIVANNNVRQVNKLLDWVIIVKKIPVDLFKLAVESVFSKFGRVVSIKIQLIGLWQKALVEFESSEIADLVVARWSVFIRKNSVHVAKAVENKQSSYVCDRCAIVCFGDEASKLAAISSVLVYKGVNLHWAGLFLACCAKCKQLDHISMECSLGRNSSAYNKWVKKQASIAHPVFFGGKTWAQVAGVSLSHVVSSVSSGAGVSSGEKPSSLMSSPPDVSGLSNHLAALECSLKLLADQVLDILKRLNGVELVLLVSPSCVFPLAIFVPKMSVLNLDMLVDSMLASSNSLPSNVNVLGAGFSFSISKVLTTKVDGLESKLSALDASVGTVLARLDHFSLVWKFATCNVYGLTVSVKQGDVVHWHKESGNMVSFITKTKLCSSIKLWIADRFNDICIFMSGLDKGFFDAGVAIIMNSSLAHHVSKVEEVSGRVISVRLLFKDKLLVTFLGLYAGASSGIRYGQAFKINSLIARAVNSSTFVVLNRDFNENRSGKSVSFKFCLNLGLVNSFVGFHLAGSSTWSNSKEVEKTIDYIFVSGNLLFTVADHKVASGGSGVNQLRDCWKFKIKDAGCVQWAKFKDLLSAKLILLGKLFSGAELCGDVDAMWAVLEKAVVMSADVTFLRHWFNKFKCSRNKHSSKFFGLELLVAKIAHAFNVLFCSGVKSESRLAKEASIRKTIERCMKNFCLDKDSMIRSVLNRPFHKVVLDHLVVDNKLILEPEEMKLNTRKCSVLSVLSDLWAHQYAPLEYVQDDTFSGVMCVVNMDKLLLVVFSLPDSKAAGLFGISNELWKHSGEVALRCLLKLLNMCLTVGLVPAFARKIIFKILFDHISVACNKFNVLQDDNFLVLKGTSTQSLVFAVRSVVKDALEKNRENIQKAYDLVEWHHLKTSLWYIKMCDRFIRFFGGIYEDRVNRVMTDFGLSGGYRVYDGLDQGKRIFYDPLLYKVKRHEQLCRYRINTRFVSKTGWIESGGSLTSYFSAGAFVNDTIWIGNCQAFTQYALNITSKFFEVNDISINSEKTVAILINQGVKVASLSICGQSISIAKKGEAHCYLGIFLFTKGLSKPSVAKAHTDTITDKQFLYLVLAVLQPIVSYRIQFSFVSFSVCHKWDVLVRKSLRSKACLPCNFSDAALHHLSLYNLKPFKQVQSEEKVAALIMFSNAPSILGHLFSHRFLDLQVLNWAPLDSLQFLVRLCVSPVNNFLAGLVKIFLDNKLSLANNFSTAFCSPGHFPLSSILGKSLYFDSVKSLKCFGVVFGDRFFDKKGGFRLDSHGPVPHWFMVASEFFLDKKFLSFDTPGSFELHGLNVLRFSEFFAIKNGLHIVWLGFFGVYTNGSLKNAGSAEVASGAAAYFLALDLSVDVVVWGFMSFTMAKLQAVVLSLEDKDLNVSWAKVKSHFRISGNVRANLAAGAASGSPFSLLANVHKHFLVAKSTASVCYAHWKAGSGYDVVPDVIVGCVDWVATARSQVFNTLLLYDESCAQEIASDSRKRLYNRYYPGMLCLLCGGVEFSDHAFTCVHESGIHNKILAETSACWSAVAGVFDCFLSAVLWVLSQCSIDVGLYALVCKGFVLDEWLRKACCVVDDQKLAVAQIVDFVRFIVELYCARV
ncbi:hypothetical protein G9A89_021793 [Geosiphon pyriformis]|nr:hypothetical protein G9A89_021793 [Geosiphon pyriformis]